MRFPQVSERVKEAPAHALRAVFAGIGQFLLVTDRLRNRPAQQDQVPRPRGPEPAGQAAQTPAAEPAAGAPAAPGPATATPAAAAPAGTAAEDRAARQGGAAAGEATTKPGSQAAQAGKPVTEEERRRSLERTGNVRLLPDGAEAPAAETPAAGTPAAETPAAGTPAAEAPAPREAAAPAASPGAEPPIPNYEQLSLASLRARLRGLTLAGVRELIDYERAHAGRQDVIAMYERRVAKLESPEG
ncbi:MAG TPA: hypothetical protein VE733_22255 [Streptosporangiaceae bacterium]|jgi:hypothetical protein|nr:hypothetical protein [Streptosporangiaceae bacterium]